MSDRPLLRRLPVREDADRSVIDLGEGGEEPVKAFDDALILRRVAERLGGTDQT